MRKSARQLRSMMRNRTRTRSWSKKGLRSERSNRPKLAVTRSRKKVDIDSLYKEHGEEQQVEDQEARLQAKEESTVRAIPLPYTHIDCNEFFHRGHKQLVEDDIPVCACKVVKGDPESACGDHCLNVLTSNECTPGFCPCGDLCKNQRFQHGKCIKTKLIKTEERGWGLLAAQDVKMGEFVMEYCGEVISCEEARKRSQAYEAQGLQDAYIISLSGSESIDATRKGSLARFINHSCAPNCETRKWTVLGEVRVGIFAKHDIKSGTELTYDYNFEWYGGAKVRCRCGAAPCVGFLGAKSRGFQNDSYVWEDNDDRYSVENVPLYDSEDDEPLSNFFKRAQVSNKLKKAPKKNTGSEQPSSLKSESIEESSLLKDLEGKKSSLNGTSEEANEQLLVCSEKCSLVEVTIGNNGTATEKAAETLLASNLEKIEDPVTVVMTKEDLHGGTKAEEIEITKSSEEEKMCLKDQLASPHKRPRFLGPQQSKNIINKRVKARSVCRFLSSETACSELLRAEEVETIASTELNRLHEELRPMVEDLGKDGQDNLPIASAEQWIAAACKQLRAKFDFNFSVVRQMSCLSSQMSNKTLLPK